MERREGEDYVLGTAFNCDGKYNAEAARIFRNVRITHLSIGRNLGPEGCGTRAPVNSAPNGLGVRTTAPIAPHGAPRTGLGPSFDCNSLTATLEPLPQLICMDAGLARLDLAFSQAFQALRQQVGEAGLRDLRREAVEFTNGVLDRCGIPRNGTATPELLRQSRACTASRYEGQRQIWLRSLGPEARQEAERPLAMHIELQRALQTLGHIPDTAAIDGVYGPATRSAIMSWQRAAGLPTAGWLSDRDASVLTAAVSSNRSSTSDFQAQAEALRLRTAELEKALNAISEPFAVAPSGENRGTNGTAAAPQPDVGSQPNPMESNVTLSDRCRQRAQKDEESMNGMLPGPYRFSYTAAAERNDDSVVPQLRVAEISQSVLDPAGGQNTVRWICFFEAGELKKVQTVLSIGGKNITMPADVDGNPERAFERRARDNAEGVISAKDSRRRIWNLTSLAYSLLQSSADAKEMEAQCKSYFNRATASRESESVALEAQNMCVTLAQVACSSPWKLNGQASFLPYSIPRMYCRSLSIVLGG
ncbi:peptidoglycan-binding protein [Belnapia sp. T18]|uniref:Peptidoglycan-binding protein n=1 Tax=Belnapia arida TaxID=2804533 RepID=A0ABS1UDD0_9PROT|nr:peptidoglycan-binding domain-containing protein [Belnapia arida]MBL6082673.1 peptidoglycan-binding protein [Belnapia arida]